MGRGQGSLEKETQLQKQTTEAVRRRGEKGVWAQDHRRNDGEQEVTASCEVDPEKQGRGERGKIIFCIVGKMLNTFRGNWSAVEVVGNGEEEQKECTGGRGMRRFGHGGPRGFESRRKNLNGMKRNGIGRKLVLQSVPISLEEEVSEGGFKGGGMADSRFLSVVGWVLWEAGRRGRRKGGGVWLKKKKKQKESVWWKKTNGDFSSNTTRP